MLKSHSIRWVYNRWPLLTNGEIARLLGVTYGQVQNALLAENAPEAATRPETLPDAVQEGATLEAVRALCKAGKPGGGGDAFSKSAKVRWLRDQCPGVGLTSIASALRMRTDHAKAALSVDGPELAAEMITPGLRACAESLRRNAPRLGPQPGARPYFGLEQAAAALGMTPEQFKAGVAAELEKQGVDIGRESLRLMRPPDGILRDYIDRAVESVRLSISEKDA